MVKAKKLIRQNLGLVDVIIELVDARIPLSSRNPDMQSIFNVKPRMVVLNKEDLAAPDKTKAWCAYFREQGTPAIALNSTSGRGMAQIVTIAKALVEDKMETLRLRGRRDQAIRAMVVGIPNVGKSAFINSLTKRAVARVGDKPGVTRGKQWIRIGQDVELLDMPGILWPKFEDPEVGFKLAVTGAVSDLVYDLEEVGVRLLSLLTRVASEALRSRYQVDASIRDEIEAYELLKEIGKRRGFLQAGGQVDTVKTAYMIIQEFRDGKIGRITLDELPIGDI
jgi:ribosome biogenesis GTPase A